MGRKTTTPDVAVRQAIDEIVRWCRRAELTPTKPVKTESNTIGDDKSVGTAKRDAWIRAEYNARGKETYHSPTRIAKKWNSLEQDKRGAICPTAASKVSKAAVEKVVYGRPKQVVNATTKRKRTAKKPRR